MTICVLIGSSKAINQQNTFGVPVRLIWFAFVGLAGRGSKARSDRSDWISSQAMKEMMDQMVRALQRVIAGLAGLAFTNGYQWIVDVVACEASGHMPIFTTSCL